MSSSRRTGVVLMCALVVAASLRARLGDTPEDAQRRYGAGREMAVPMPATEGRRYAAGPLVLEAEFIDGRIHRLRYHKATAFTEAEIQQLLADNAGGYAWAAQDAKHPLAPGRAPRQGWDRSDRGSAVLETDADGAQALVLTDGVFLLAKLHLIDAAPPGPAGASVPGPAQPPAPRAAGPVVGEILLVAGGLFALLTMQHDFRRQRMYRIHAQFAPKRIAPEVHFLAALVGAAGATAIWTWPIGFLWFAGQWLITLLLPRLLARIF